MRQEQLQGLKKAAKEANSPGEGAEKMATPLDTQRLEKDFQRINQRLSRKTHELDVSTYYLKKILSHMSQGLLFINLAGTITTCNKAAEIILGVQALEILFCHFETCFKDDFFGFSMSEALANRKVPSMRTTELGTEEPCRREIEIEARIILNDDCEAISERWDESLDPAQGMILLLRDVTVERQLKRLSDRNDRLKELGEMAAMVAHEIRNPLGGIKGFASLLQRDLNNQPELQKMASYILEGTENLNRFVTNVLSYSRPVQLQSRVVELVEQLQKLRTSVQMDASLSKSIIILVKSDVDSLRLSVDMTLLQAALFNLVVNAVHAMPNGGTITLALAATDKEAAIHVSDTGTGITPEHLEKIFSPFFTTKSAGNGFGLTEVNKVVQAHGGTVEVRSQLGHGTTFTIKLPIKQLTPAAT